MVELDVFGVMGVGCDVGIVDMFLFNYDLGFCCYYLLVYDCYGFSDNFMFCDFIFSLFWFDVWLFFDIFFDCDVLLVVCELLGKVICYCQGNFWLVV